MIWSKTRKRNNMTCEVMVKEENRKFNVIKDDENLGTISEDWAERVKAALEKDDIHEKLHERERLRSGKLSLQDIMEIIEEALEEVDPRREIHEQKRVNYISAEKVLFFF